MPDTDLFEFTHLALERADGVGGEQSKGESPSWHGSHPRDADDELAQTSFSDQKVIPIKDAVAVNVNSKPVQNFDFEMP